MDDVMLAKEFIKLKEILKVEQKHLSFYEMEVMVKKKEKMKTIKNEMLRRDISKKEAKLLSKSS